MVLAGGCSSGDGGAVAGQTSAATSDSTLPDAPLRPLDGGATTTLAAYRGRPLVVNLWAPWCVPCRTEMPELEAQHQRYGDTVAFVGISDGADEASSRQAAAASGVTYPLLVDDTSAFQLALGVSNLPATAFVDADGRVVSVKLGRVSPGDVEAGVAAITGGTQ